MRESKENLYQDFRDILEYFFVPFLMKSSYSFFIIYYARDN